MQFVITILQFLLGLTFIVGVHELGHLLFAKVFKMRVKSYIIGCPPKIVKFKLGDTEYALGSIPLGGAVQIEGMIDESLATDNFSNQSQPWEFRSKPAWQRLIVILGGIVFNLVSGVMIYIVLNYTIGSVFLPKDQVNKYGIYPNELGRKLGFQEGDKIVKINGKDFKYFDDVMSASLLLSSHTYYTVERHGVWYDIPIPRNILEQLMDKRHGDMAFYIEPITPYIIKSVVPNSSFALKGLKAGDQLISIAEQSVLYVHQLEKALRMHVGKEVLVSYISDGLRKNVMVTIDHGKNLNIARVLPVKHVSYSVLESIAMGISQVHTLVCQYFLGIWNLITGQLSIKKSLSGPIGIVRCFDHEFVWDRFWRIIAHLSISIALTNLLPIPALDGGHALFLIYECLFRRKPSDKFLTTVQKMGMIFLLLIMLFVIGNDIFNLLN